MTEYPNAHRHPPMPSRNAAILQHDGERAKREAHAADTDRRRNLAATAESFTVGEFGTHQGRPMTVVYAPKGIAIMDGGRVLHGSYQFGLAHGEQVKRFVSLLRESFRAEVGQLSEVTALDRVLVIERTGNGVQIRDSSNKTHGGVLFGMNSLQADKLAALLTKVK